MPATLRPSHHFATTTAALPARLEPTWSLMVMMMVPTSLMVWISTLILIVHVAPTTLVIATIIVVVIAPLLGLSLMWMLLMVLMPTCIILVVTLIEIGSSSLRVAPIIVVSSLRSATLAIVEA